jgi:transcriptional regulator with XRE-family HTH domain
MARHDKSRGVSIAEAIVSLRGKLGATQQELADRLKIRVGTVSAYEQGTREPSQRILRSLSEIARACGFKRLRAAFDSQRAGAVASTLTNLPTEGRQRRVSKSELESWKNWLLKSIASLLDDAVQKMEPLTVKVHHRGIPDPPEHKVEVAVDELVDILGYVRGARGTAEWLASEIQMYIDGSIPMERPELPENLEEPDN